MRPPVRGRSDTREVRETGGTQSSRKMSSQKLVKMYNLNVNVATTLPVSFLGLDGQSSTPRTPEIVNSLVAMTNPFDALMKPTRENRSPGSEESCSGTGSPLGSPTSSPPSVQHTRSQLIKEGLKLTIQTKRKQSGSDTKEDLEEFETKRTKKEELTEEDEERRKRRRERNKIAATKCRMKKREKTKNLVNESELLETQNVELKTQIKDLQKEKRNLINMLSMHAETCVKQISTNIQNQTFEEFVGAAEPFANGFEAHPVFSSEPPPEFEIGSTNGTAMNPYGKDPNFAKLLDEVGNAATNYSRSYERPFPSAAFNNSSNATNYYPYKNRSSKASEPRCFEYQSEKKSAKDKEIPVRCHQTNEEEGDVFRTSFHCSHDNDDADSYKPNGIIDGNFFANRTDNIFGAGTDYVSAFGNNPLDNGCMA